MSSIMGGGVDDGVVVGREEVVLARSFGLAILTITSDDVVRATHLVVCA